MGLITQYSRISHHTIFGQTGVTFSVPSSEDFTDGTWEITDLCLSEIGVSEDEGKVYIRIGDEVKQFQMIGASGSVSLSLSDVLTTGNATNGQNIIMSTASVISNATGTRYLNIGDEYLYLHSEDGVDSTGFMVYPDRIMVDSIRGIEYAGDYSAQFGTYSLVDKSYVDSVAGGGPEILSQVLSNGNDSGTHSIIMGTGTSIYSSASTGKIFLDHAGTAVRIETSYADDNFIAVDADIQIGSTDGTQSSSIAVSKPSITILSSDDINSNELVIDPSNAIFTSSTGYGIEYAGDYSATFTDRSIVDKAYVDTVAIGAIGPTGPQGLPGFNGADGIDGATGPAGPQGETGATGPAGPQGATGPQGIQGIQGPQGATGPQGEAGVSGTQSLSQTLVYGNNTGGNNIVLSNGDKVQHYDSSDLSLYAFNDGTFNTLQLGDGSDSYFRIREDWDAIMRTNFGTNYAHISMSVEDSNIDLVSAAPDFSTIVSLTLTPTSAQFIDGRPTQTGIEYSDDYSATFTDRSLVDKAYVDGSIMTSTASNAIAITRSLLIAGLSASTLKKDATYYITDKKIWLQALDTNIVSTIGKRKMAIIKSEAYPDDNGLTRGVWSSLRTPLALSSGDKMIFGGKLWSNNTGNNGSNINHESLDSTNWTLITSDSLYYDKIFDVEYDLINDRIIKQSDDRGNIIYNVPPNPYQSGYIGTEITDWGYEGITFNEANGIFNNAVPSAFATMISGNRLISAVDYSETNLYQEYQIFENIGCNINENRNRGSIFLNNAIAISKNDNQGSILLNESDIVGNSNIGSIEQNSLSISGVLYNSNKGSIVGNYCHTVERNSNIGSIEENTNDGVISYNSNNGSIVYNTNTGDINNNILNGNIDSNANAGNISNNANNGSISSNTSGESDIEKYGQIGSYIGGGVLAATWTLSDGVTNQGLVISTTNLGATAWSNVSSTLIGTTAQSNYYGLTNSDAIVAQATHAYSAAQLAKSHNGGGFSDWYLPSSFEMQEIIKNKFILHEVLGDTDGLQTLYWTSTEVNATTAYYASVSNYTISSTSKSNSTFGGSPLQTRAIRKVTL